MQRPIPEIPRKVHVPEDKMIDGVRQGVLSGIFNQRLGQRSVETASRTLPPGLFIGPIVPLAGFPAPPAAQLHGQIGMHAPRKEPSERLRAETAVHKFQHRLPVDLHVVAVGHENPASGERQQLRRGVYLHAAFAREVIPDPHVVISREEDHADAAIGQFGEFAQRAHEALRHHPPVFEPEVENVTHEKNRLRITRRSIKPRHEPPFERPGRCVIARSQVYVGGEVDHHRVSSSSFRSSSSP